MVLLNSALLMCLIATLTAASKPISNISVQLNKAEEFSEMAENYIDAQPIYFQMSPIQIPMVAKELYDAKTVLIYTMGQRVNGDRIASSDKGNNSWNSPQNVRLLLTYPASGDGVLISYVQVEVSQSNSEGRAYVLSGGIGQRSIEIVVEAKDTLWFNYFIRIYGY